jgi:hypothetical protein
VSVTIPVHNWAAVAQPAGYDAYSSQPLACIAGNSGTAGNWMVAVWAVRQEPSGNPATCAVGDDAHNYWEPLGPPNGVSSASGVTRCGIWVSRSPRAAGNAYLSPTSPVKAMILTVFEVAGLTPWESLSAIVTSMANAATALGSLSLPSPGAPALLLTACASDNSASTVSLGGAGWSMVTGSTPAITNGSDHTADLEFPCMWQVTSAAASPAWSASPAADLSGFAALILVTVAAPVPASQSWPMVQLLAGFGSGAGTPWDQVTFTDISARFQKMGTQRGKQYELDTAQAGTVNFALSNNDGALTPGYASSPYQPEVYTPVLVLVTWPPPPNAAARPYAVFRGYMERWPQAITKTRYQVTNAVASDVLAQLTPLSLTVTRAEILLDNPAGYWPCGDPAGNTTVQNLAQGSQLVMQVTQAKGGNGGATQAFGASSASLCGDGGATSWSQSGLGAGETTQGYTLQVTSGSMPSLAAGVTLEGWFTVDNTVQPATVNLLMSLTGPAGPVFQVILAQSTGFLYVRAYDKVTRAMTQTLVSNLTSFASSVGFHLALTLTQTGWQVYINAGAFPGATGSCNLAPGWYTLSFNGQATRAATGAMFNGVLSELVLFPEVLGQDRIVTHYWATLLGLAATDTAGRRIDRLMLESGCGYPRVITATTNGIQGAVDQQGQQLAQNIVNMAESDGGLLFVDGPGYVFYMGRGAGYNLPVTGTFGENTAAGEYPYLDDIGFDDDPAQVYNDITLTQLSAPQVIGAADVSAVVTPVSTAAVAASVEQYGDQTLQQTSYLFDLPIIQDSANWIFWTNGTPQIRVAQLTLDPGANPALWPVALGVEVGQVYTVNRRLGGTQVVITGEFQVMSVAHTVQGRRWQTKLTLVTYPGVVLTADDSVRGLLNGSNRLSW